MDPKRSLSESGLTAVTGYHRPRGLETGQTSFSQFWGHWQIWEELVCWFTEGQPVPGSSHGSGAGEAFEGLFHKSTDLLGGGSTLMTQSPPEGPGS